MPYGTTATMLPATGGLTLIALHGAAPDWFQIGLSMFLVALSVYGLITLKLGERLIASQNREREEACF